MLVETKDWLDGKTLLKAALSHEGVLVLGIQRSDGTYSGAPRAAEVIRAGDTLILYGLITRLKELDQRGVVSGDSEHQQAADDHAAEARRPPAA